MFFALVLRTSIELIAFDKVYQGILIIYHGDDLVLK